VTDREDGKQTLNIPWNLLIPAIELRWMGDSRYSLKTCIGESEESGGAFLVFLIILDFGYVYSES